MLDWSNGGASWTLRQPLQGWGAEVLKFQENDVRDEVKKVIFFQVQCVPLLSPERHWAREGRGGSRIL